MTPTIQRVADRESLDPEFVRQQVADGQVVIPNDHAHESLDPTIIGRDFATKVNANTGSSETTSDIQDELTELHTAVHYGLDTVMDLSTGTNLDAIRKANITHSPVPIGTVPIYEAIKRVDSPTEITHDLLFDIIENRPRRALTI